MICVIDDNKQIINIVDTDRISADNERPYYPWNELWEQYTDEMPLEYAKSAKLAVLKAERDTKEVEPIEYNGNSFDYDEKARDRINAAIIALDLAGEIVSLSWTTADNTEATVTAADLRNIIAAVAVRSNTLHVAYRNAKTTVEAATTKEELEAITLEL